MRIEGVEKSIEAGGSGAGTGVGVGVGVSRMMVMRRMRRREGERCSRCSRRSRRGGGRREGEEVVGWVGGRVCVLCERRRMWLMSGRATTNPAN